MQVRTKRSDKRNLVQRYIERYDPYKPSVCLGYNVKKVAEYARQKGCRISDLKPEEIKMFEVQKKAAE